MNINYQELQIQRNTLLSILVRANENEKESILGVVSLLEALLDDGIARGLCCIDHNGDVL
jgi:hypothetical protein